MKFTQGAKRLIEKNLEEIMGYMTLYEKERGDVEKELRSGFYEGSEAKAREKGSDTVTEEDVKNAISDEGTPKEIAAAYMKSYAGSLKRAGFWPRAAAYIIDSLLISFLIALLILPVILIAYMLDNSLLMATDLGFSPLSDGNALFTAFIVLLNLFVGLVILGLLVCYFIVVEGRFGRTPGKYIMGLRVLKADGTKIDYKDALLRNIPKFFHELILIDALIMVIFFNKEKQRGFDKVANTIVVHA